MVTATFQLRATFCVARAWTYSNCRLQGQWCSLLKIATFGVSALQDTLFHSGITSSIPRPRSQPVATDPPLFTLGKAQSDTPTFVAASSPHSDSPQKLRAPAPTERFPLLLVATVACAGPVALPSKLVDLRPPHCSFGVHLGTSPKIGVGICDMSAHRRPCILASRSPTALFCPRDAISLPIAPKNHRHGREVYGRTISILTEVSTVSQNL